MYVLEEQEQLGARIKVIGVGGCGCNAVNNMINVGLRGVDFLACNTDIQTLKSSMSLERVQLGVKLTRGLGAGGNPEVGRQAAQESEDDIRESLKGADMVFIATGLGGGTGTGASPIVARIAREMGALTVAVATKPFPFEGKRKMTQAQDGEMELTENVDALIIIPNHRLLSLGGKNIPMLEAFRKADDILTNAVRGISDLINNTGLVNVDFNDVRAVMTEKGKALMGIGMAAGENRALEAAQAAISSPLLEDMDISGAKGLLINITGDPDITMDEIHAASTLIQSSSHEDANIIWGFVVDDGLKGDMLITVIATGFSTRPIVLARTDKENEVIRELKTAGERLIDYDRPAYLRKQEQHKEKEHVKLGMVVDDSVLDMEAYNIPTFLRKKAD